MGISRSSFYAAFGSKRGVLLTAGEEVQKDALGIQADKPAPKAAPESSSAAPSSPAEDAGEPMSLVEAEKRLIARVLKLADGNKNKAAEILKIHRTTLYKKIEEYGL